jgi:hypothetical protein
MPKNTSGLKRLEKARRYITLQSIQKRKYPHCQKTKDNLDEVCVPQLPSRAGFK